MSIWTRLLPFHQLTHPPYPLSSFLEEAEKELLRYLLLALNLQMIKSSDETLEVQQLLPYDNNSQGSICEILTFKCFKVSQEQTNHPRSSLWPISSEVLLEWSWFTSFTLIPTGPDRFKVHLRRMKYCFTTANVFFCDKSWKSLKQQNSRNLTNFFRYWGLGTIADVSDVSIRSYLMNPKHAVP